MGAGWVAESLNGQSDSSAVGVASAGGDDAQHEIEHLRRALETRTVIGQALGILMERYKITADGAFDQLKQASQRTNVRLVHIAEGLAESGAWPPLSLTGATGPTTISACDRGPSR